MILTLSWLFRILLSQTLLYVSAWSSRQKLACYANSFSQVFNPKVLQGSSRKPHQLKGPSSKSSWMLTWPNSRYCTGQHLCLLERQSRRQQKLGKRSIDCIYSYKICIMSSGIWEVRSRLVKTFRQYLPYWIVSIRKTAKNWIWTYWPESQAWVHLSSPNIRGRVSPATSRTCEWRRPTHFDDRKVA